jgi:hypothetical protein
MNRKERAKYNRDERIIDDSLIGSILILIVLMAAIAAGLFVFISFTPTEGEYHESKNMESHN